MSVRRAVYMSVRAALWALLGWPLRLAVRGADKLPSDGPAILAANHRHNIDPVVLALAAPRPVSYMAKAELFEVPVLGALSRLFYAFPVHRGAGDRAALRAAGEVLRSGEVLGIFPEGTRQSGPGLAEPQPGAALLAVTSGAPIVPAAIAGTERFRRGHERFSLLPKVRVSFGEPIHPRVDAVDRHGEMDRLLSETMDAIAALGGFPTSEEGPA